MDGVMGSDDVDEVNVVDHVDDVDEDLLSSWSFVLPQDQIAKRCV